uniref:Retrotransposon protein, putative, Ty1-copia subclass n=1 Tax=Tanacetum cinerariifolium TaxID=118510 RepID=A0A6L2IZS5_TANCI|nr:retrotransposon protein, putative, Ty1-copia subclass [Tanacetum cinerariifolium]
MDLQDKGVIDSGCSRHMIGNMSYLTDYEEINEDYVAFGGNSKGGKITRKEAVNTACYVQNKVLVVKPHNKTLYELFHGRTPTLSFMRPFICLVTILNTKDHLGKFNGKADEGFFVGYSLNSKAFREFNSKTKIVEENLHIRLSESTPNVVGSRPNWLFDIDALTRTMNYEPIFTGTQSNGFADLPNRKRAIGTKWVFRNKKDERGIVIRNKARFVPQGQTKEERIDYDEVFASVARIKEIRLFLAYASFKDFMVYRMDVKSAFPYGNIGEEVYKGDILLVQVYVDDIIFRSTRKELLQTSSVVASLFLGSGNLYSLAVGKSSGSGNSSLAVGMP